jgi:hypothetical protein
MPSRIVADIDQARWNMGGFYGGGET